MERYFAFFRGLNVGGHRIKMAHLRELLGDCGLTDVETFLASGNAVFDADSDEPAQLARRIAAHLHEALGYQVATFLRHPSTVDDLSRHDIVVDEDSDDRGMHVVFLSEFAGNGVVESLGQLETDADRFHVYGSHVFWSHPARVSDSVITTAQIDAAFGGRSHTMRNINTIRRLVAKFS